MTNLTAASIKSAGSLTTRTFADRFADVINVKDFGAVGNGTADDTAALQAAFNLAYNQPAGNGVNYHLNKPVFIPAGIYKITAPLTINNTWGAHVFGAGLTSTIIQNHTTGNTVLSLNAVGYSTFEHMRLEAWTNGIACTYDWSGTGLSAQLVTFYKVVFGGVGGHTAAYGCKVGWGTAQCDTSSWIDCVFGADVGLAVGNLNAISNRVVGGNFQSCRIGIHVEAGAFQTIAGVGFQLSSEWDIFVQGGATDAYHISGISTESTNFFKCSTTAVAAVLTGCAQRSWTNGVFAEGAVVLHIEGCQSKCGSISPGGRNTTIRNSAFWRIDALATPTYPGSVVRIENTLFGLDEGSVARRDIDVTMTPAGKRTRGIEGITLTVESVANAGVSTNLDGGRTTFPATVTIASPAVISSPSWTSGGLNGPNRHGFVADTPIAFAAGSTLPTGLVAGTVYYVLATGLTLTAFRVSTSPGGAAVNTTGSQSGTHTIYLVRMFAVGDQILKSNVAASGSPGWICTTAGHTLTGTGAGAFKTLPNVGA